MLDQTIQFMAQNVYIERFKDIIVYIVENGSGQLIILIDEHVHDHDLQIGIDISGFLKMPLYIGQRSIEIGQKQVYLKIGDIPHDPGRIIDDIDLVSVLQINADAVCKFRITSQYDDPLF